MYHKLYKLVNFLIKKIKSKIFINNRKTRFYFKEIFLVGSDHFYSFLLVVTNITRLKRTFFGKILQKNR
jgi:hypothetical protein